MRELRAGTLCQVTENDRGSTQDAERLVLCDRVHRHKAPLDQMFAALTVNRSWWLELQPGEIEPQVLEAVAPVRVVWSSLR
jgi:hypothetical protein